MILLMMHLALLLHLVFTHHKVLPLLFVVTHQELLQQLHHSLGLLWITLKKIQFQVLYLFKDNHKVQPFPQVPYNLYKCFRSLLVMILLNLLLLKQIGKKKTILHMYSIFHLIYFKGMPLNTCKDLLHPIP